MSDTTNADYVETVVIDQEDTVGYIGTKPTGAFSGPFTSELQPIVQSAGQF